MEWIKLVKRWIQKIDLKKAVTYNFWLKLIALVIAVIVWYYVSGGITRGIQI
ncbi:MAG: hypothetical protein K9L87_04745 [Candidatus Omnitrophica bacterium]|nr:hypothetical protein [Candidatus Omnitrophota bacterium]MCF7877143.1 hypothetical protein [Candidatus Omnitrophota bacterium]MCF7892396.1 hypothetical protein [Candidatus Omnitrophota bacterium]MCF7895631.1 hypothetical protein [Candidatus Omnitrophota bacterium]MCF7898038.1 hypothetical protein [Candidatus Omnitrophota bacterium]